MPGGESQSCTKEVAQTLAAIFPVRRHLKAALTRATASHNWAPWQRMPAFPQALSASSPGGAPGDPLQRGAAPAGRSRDQPRVASKSEGLNLNQTKTSES